MIEIHKIREDFPILKRKVNGYPLVYLDNAATSQTPQPVIDCIVDYYSNYNANIHRGVHTLSQEATDLYEQARMKIQEHFNLALILTFLKNFLHPLCAFILAQYIFEMQPMLVFIVTMAAALPSGAQTYYFSYRYKSLQNIISANVVLSSFVSFFTISFLLLIFGY
mgnify:CR=1 FL=1